MGVGISSRSAHAGSVKPVVATFGSRAAATSVVTRLRATFGLPANDVSIAIAAAYGEPYDGHALIAAWVPDEAEETVRALLLDSGGALHPQPWTASPRGATSSQPRGEPPAGGASTHEKAGDQARIDAVDFIESKR